MLPSSSFQNGEPVHCVHVREGIVVTLEFHGIVTELLMEMLKIWAEDLLKPDPKKPNPKLNPLKQRVAETLLTGFFPGPTADVQVMSSPDGISGANIDFNSRR